MVGTDSVVAEGLPSRAQESAPRRASAKTEREWENQRCIGGLRSPWRAVQGNPQTAAVGRLLRAALEKALKEHPALEKTVDGGVLDEEAPEQVAAMAAARAAIAEALGCAHPQDCGMSRHWQPHLVQAWVTAAGDV